MPLQGWYCRMPTLATPKVAPSDKKRTVRHCYDAAITSVTAPLLRRSANSAREEFANLGYVFFAAHSGAALISLTSSSFVPPAAIQSLTSCLSFIPGSIR